MRHGDCAEEVPRPVVVLKTIDATVDRHRPMMSRQPTSSLTEFAQVRSVSAIEVRSSSCGKADDVPDPLADFLDAPVAAALQKWAQRAGGTVSLPSQRWKSGGSTGAILTAIFLELSGPDGRPTIHKRILKVLPARMEQEAGRHEAAWHSNEEFSAKHFARQPAVCFPVGDGDQRFLMLQEIAGDLVDYRPLKEVSPQLRAEVGAAVVRLILQSWNGKRWPEHPERSRALVSDYLRWELRTKIGEIEDWAAGNGLAARGQQWIDGDEERLPNPIGMVQTGLSVHRVIVDYLWGLTHGDLHQGNVLVPYVERPPGELAEPLTPQQIRIIDLAGFDPAAPLTRDVVTLSLSLAAVEFGSGHGVGDAEELVQTLVSGGERRRAANGVAGQVRAVLSAADSVPAPLRGEWRAQYLLSLLAGALAHTTYDNVGDDGRRWFFHLAARAAAEFIEFAGRTHMIPPEPETEDRPDQILIGVVSADADRAAAFALRDRLVHYAYDRLPWTVHLLRRREENRSATDKELRSSPDLLLHFLTVASLGDFGCRREVELALSGGVRVIAIRSDPEGATLDDPDGVPVVDLVSDDAAGFGKLLEHIAQVASAKRVQSRILEDLERSEREEQRAEGTQRRRFGFFNREQRVRLEEERRRAAPTVSPARPEPPELTGTTVSRRDVRLVNEAPKISDATFHDRVTEMHQVEDAIADAAVRLVVVAGDVGSGKTAFAAEMRRRLALDNAAAAVDAVVYLSADGYRAITVATILSDMVESLADEEERRRLNQRLTDPIAWQEKLTEVMTALGGRKVVVILDAAEHLLNRDGDFRDQELHRLLRKLATVPGHGTTLVLTVAGGLPRQLRAEPGQPVRMVTLKRGLPFDAAMDFLIGLDRTAVLGIAGLPDRDRLRVHAVSLGHPRTLELLVGVLLQRPASTAADLLDELEQVEPGGAATILFDRMFAGLNRTEERVVQALAAFRRPVPPQGHCVVG
jgi:hypothetical protein